MTRSLARSLESRETEPLDESDSGSDLDVWLYQIKTYFVYYNKCFVI